MKIFVTVGTTRFDRLVSYIANSSFFREHQVVLQVGPGGQHVDNFKCFDYSKDIDKFYNQADVVISHAGAGTIFRLLDLQKPLVIVPNLDRIDQHQSDIADFMHRNNYAISVDKLDNLEVSISQAANTKFNRFTAESFFVGHDIIEFVS